MQVFHTWDFAAPTDYAVAKIQTSTFLRGYSWQTWKDALTARIIARGGTPAAEIIEAGTSPGTVYFKGGAFFDACSMCDYVWVRIGTPLAQVLEIQTRSRIGTKVGFFFFNFESHNIAPQYTAPEEGLRLISRQNFLETGVGGCDDAGHNGYGAVTIDKYESNDRSGSPCSATWSPSNYVVANPKFTNAAIGSKHTAECDVRDPDYIQALVSQFETHDTPYYVAGAVTYPMRYQMQMWDNAGGNPYGTTTTGGSAVNEFPAGYAAAYQGSYNPGSGIWTGWKGLLGHLKSRYAYQGPDFIWGNATEKTPDSTPVSGEPVGYYTADELPNRYVEFFFARPGTNNVQRTIASIQQAIDDCAGHNLRIALGALTGVGATWATTAGGGGGPYGTWEDIRARVEAKNAWDKIIPVAARSTATAYIFWQAGFRDLA